VRETRYLKIFMEERNKEMKCQEGLIKVLSAQIYGGERVIRRKVTFLLIGGGWNLRR